MNKLQLTGAALAVGAAAMFALAPAFAADPTSAPMVHCKGGNACKGKGVAMMSKADCDKAGGTVAD